jgi:hypothetical protein
MSDVMSKDVLKRLRAESRIVSGTIKVLDDAADEIERLRAENAKLREVLEWYSERARLARLIHSEGDSGRQDLVSDGGAKARAALQPVT